MFKALSQTFSVSLPTFHSLCRFAVLQTLSKMRKGKLAVTLPNQEPLTFGGEEKGINADLQILDENFFHRVVFYGEIGFGESYMAGEWKTTDLVGLISYWIANQESLALISGSKAKAFLLSFLQVRDQVIHLFRENTLKGSKRNIQAHYDLGNEFFQSFLDSTLTYSSAYFKKGRESLEEAQTQKYERICEKLEIRPKDHVLEIGSGWGGFACYAAKTYGCRVTTLTLSARQREWALQRIQQEGLSGQVRVELKDYREVQGEFDHIISIEMLEAVGHRYLPRFFKICDQVLKKKGKLALQVILFPDSRYEGQRRQVNWIQKHIFPGSLLPSVTAIQQALSHTDLWLSSFEEMGLSYAQTLSLWRKKFNSNLQSIRGQGFNEEFIRKWDYYFALCEAAFRMRHINVGQLVYARPNR